MSLRGATDAFRGKQPRRCMGETFSGPTLTSQMTLPPDMGVGQNEATSEHQFFFCPGNPFLGCRIFDPPHGEPTREMGKRPEAPLDPASSSAGGNWHLRAFTPGGWGRGSLKLLWFDSFWSPKHVCRLFYVFPQARTLHSTCALQCQHAVSKGHFGRVSELGNPQDGGCPCHFP